MWFKLWKGRASKMNPKWSYNTNSSTKSLWRNVGSKLGSNRSRSSVGSSDSAPDDSDARAINNSLCTVDKSNTLAQVEFGILGCTCSFNVYKSGVFFGVALSSGVASNAAFRIESVWSDGFGHLLQVSCLVACFGRLCSSLWIFLFSHMNMLKSKWNIFLLSESFAKLFHGPNPKKTLNFSAFCWFYFPRNCIVNILKFSNLKEM